MNQPVRPVLEHAAQAFADANSTPPFLYQLPPEQGRALANTVQTDPPPTLLDADVSDLTIDGGPTGTVRVRIVRPPGATGVLPVILYVHGLGWVFGGPQTHDRLVRELAVGARAAVVFPDYDLAPEAKYPTQIEQVVGPTVVALAERTLDHRHQPGRGLRVLTLDRDLDLVPHPATDINRAPSISPARITGIVER